MENLNVHFQKSEVEEQKYYHYEASNQKRFLNHLADMIVIAIIYLFVNFILHVSIDHYSQIEKANPLLGTFIVYIIMLIYITLFEMLYGVTLGKLLTGTKLISINGKPLSVFQVLFRNLLRIVPFDNISFLTHAKWHDNWSKTAVVEKAYLKNYGK